MPGRKRHAGLTASCLIILVWVLGTAGPLTAGHVVGIEFVEAPRFAHVMDPLSQPFDNVHPYLVTSPDTPFSASGALDGYSEADLRQAVAIAVQQAFVTAQIGVPGKMLNVDIRLGAVGPEVGTVALVADAWPDRAYYGIAKINAANDRPDLAGSQTWPTNAFSVTLVDTLSRLQDQGIVWTRFDQVVHTIAGTVAHEIAHTLGVERDVPGTEPYNGWYPIMGSGGTGLPSEVRLGERRFVDMPGTQPDGRSVPQVLMASAGLVDVTDFNFDGGTDASDWNIVRSNLGNARSWIKTGDANTDGATDVTDLNMVLTNLGSGLDAMAVAEVVFDLLADGTLQLRTQGAEVISVKVVGEAAIEDRYSAGLYAGMNADGSDLCVYWSDHFNGAQQWVLDHSAALNLRGFVGEHALAVYAGNGILGAQVEYHIAGSGTHFAVVIPEPSTIGLLILGGLWVLRRRRNRG